MTGEHGSTLPEPTPGPDATLTPEFAAYLDLIDYLETEVVNRSENDLSSRLARALESLGLHAVMDTGGCTDRFGRPGIPCYVDEGAADHPTQRSHQLAQSVS